MDFCLSRLESLSTELVLSVLQHVSSATDLESLVSASPRYRRVFAQHKLSVLAAVVKSAIPCQEVLCDAVAACHASTIAVQRLSSPGRRRSWTREADLDRKLESAITDFMRLYRRTGVFEEASSTERRLTHDPKLLWRLFRMLKNVEFFVSLYQRGAFGAIKDVIDQSSAFSASPRLSWEELSTTEKSRLQRAFFRFEIYRKLFAFRLQQSRFDPILDARKRASLFLTGLPFWEREEIASIFEFLVRYARDMIEKVEDDFVEVALEKGTFLREAPSWLVKDDDGHARPGFSDAWTRFQHMDLIGFHMFSEEIKPEGYKDHVLTIVQFGLPYLRALNSLDWRGKFHFLDPWCDQMRNGDYDDHHLGVVLDWLEPEALQVNEEDRNDKPLQPGAFLDSLQECNTGWQWAKRGALFFNEHRVNYGERNFFRRMGYVFWDCDRFKQLGLLDLDLDAALDGEILFYESETELYRHQHRHGIRLLAVEKRLEGVQVSRNFLVAEAPEHYWGSSGDLDDPREHMFYKRVEVCPPYLAEDREWDYEEDV